MPAGFGFGVPNDQLLRYSSEITIEELTGSGENTPRKIVLRGPSLPFQGAEWAAGNTLVTTFYPGNPIGSQQYLGPKEMPSSWQGEWNRNTLGKAPVLFTDETGTDFQIVRPDLVWTVLEDVLRRGAMLRVTWSTHGNELVGDEHLTQQLRLVNFDVVRDGRASSWKFQPDRHTDIKWNIQFDWVGRGGDQLRTADVRADSNLADAANGLENSIASTQFFAATAIQSIKSDIRLSASHLTLGQLETLANAPNLLVEQYTRKLQAAVNDIRRVGDLANKFRSAPFQIANTVVNFAKNTLAVTNQFIDQMGRQPPEQMTLKSNVRDTMRSWSFFNKMGQQAHDNAKQAQDIIDRNNNTTVTTAGAGKLTVKESSSTRAGNIIGTYITKNGDTPQRISMRYFQTPDRALDILRANRLPWHTAVFTSGIILIIPAIATVQRQ